MVEATGNRGLPMSILPMSPPGLESLYLACRNVYPDQLNPLQVAAVVKFWLGGPDPLDYISMYSNPGNPKLDIPPHWHYISFGLSDLHGDGRVHERSTPGGLSGFGFELTFRLKREPEETSPPTWPATLLQSLAKYVFHSGNCFCAGDHISWHQALDGSESLLQHMLLAVDPQLDTVNTPCGTVDFIQVVGVCKEELKAAQKWNGLGVLDILKNIPRGAGGSLWLVTDMRRGETMYELDTNVSQVVEAGIDKEGSNLSGVTAQCSWTDANKGACGGEENSEDNNILRNTICDDDENPVLAHGRGTFGLGELESNELLQTKVLDSVHLTFNTEAGGLLPLAVRGRLKHGRHFTFKSAIDTVAITLVAESVTGTFVNPDKPLVSHGPWLQVLVQADLVDRMLDDLKPLSSEHVIFPKTFSWPDKNLSITILADNSVLNKTPLLPAET
ncbi:suppressor of fused homolog [Cimex lectularius]|uniref:Suppressor of fused homolog n=1 Tax=Cimex lectularius TaxID=79782 RepID=A0A8I6S1S1_CIMLE|nr:suppressor of fused homolog [Cimex lectularius]